MKGPERFESSVFVARLNSRRSLLVRAVDGLKVRDENEAPKAGVIGLVYVDVEKPLMHVTEHAEL
jgi:hypothetical protein